MSRKESLVLALDEAQVIDITRILLDEDAGGAIDWMRQVTQREHQCSGAKLGIVLEGEAAATFRGIIKADAVEKALRFLRENLEDELKRSRNPHCVPVFEACYKPNQADSYLTDKEG